MSKREIIADFLQARKLHAEGLKEKIEQDIKEENGDPYWEHDVRMKLSSIEWLLTDLEETEFDDDEQENINE